MHITSLPVKYASLNFIQIRFGVDLIPDVSNSIEVEGVRISDKKTISILTPLIG